MNENKDDPFKNTADSLHAYRRRVASHLDELLSRKRSEGSPSSTVLVDDVTVDFDELIQRLDKSRIVQLKDSFLGPVDLYESNDMNRPVDAINNKGAKKRSPYSTYTADDYSRIIHSRSFRRLQGKTQLFPAGESDLLRTRLTHTLEVAEIASRIAGALNQQSTKEKIGGKIDIAIVTAASLAHDIGHPPFGHQGELVLNEIMSGFGGFEGNAQTLRIITKLENRFSSKTPAHLIHWDVFTNPKGLNLLYRTIASTIKYDNRVHPFYNGSDPSKGYYASEQDIVDDVRSRLSSDPKARISTIECQIMDLADDIAYSTYDLEDCVTSEVANCLTS